MNASRGPFSLIYVFARETTWFLLFHAIFENAKKIDQLYKIPILFCKIIISKLEKKWYLAIFKHPFQMMSDSENRGTWKRVLQKVQRKKMMHRASIVNKFKEKKGKPGALNWWEPMKTPWHEYMEAPHIR